MSSAYLRMIAKFPTPVFNTPNLNEVFKYPLPLDDQGLLRHIETVLFPGSVVKVVQMCDRNVVQIETDEYPGGHLFTDQRFLEATEEAKVREKKCPSLKEILYKLRDWPKMEYIWGGNFKGGVSQLEIWYPIPKEADFKTRIIWLLKGADCSGLLYEVTEGSLPRNTSGLKLIGNPVPIEGKSDKEIAELLLPGDLIVWSGHVMIVEEGGVVFECRLNDGTIRTPLEQRLGEIRSERNRTPVDDPLKNPKTSYVVRRWHPDVLEIEEY